MLAPQFSPLAIGNLPEEQKYPTHWNCTIYSIYLYIYIYNYKYIYIYNIYICVYVFVFPTINSSEVKWSSVSTSPEMKSKGWASQQDLRWGHKAPRLPRRSKSRSSGDTHHKARPLPTDICSYVRFRLDLPPTQDSSAKWRFIGIPYQKCNNPGGDCYWVGGRPKI